jgi:hypothetical protein
MRLLSLILATNVFQISKAEYSLLKGQCCEIFDSGLYHQTTPSGTLILEFSNHADIVPIQPEPMAKCGHGFKLKKMKGRPITTFKRVTREFFFRVLGFLGLGFRGGPYESPKKSCSDYSAIPTFLLRMPIEHSFMFNNVSQAGLSILF